MSLHRKFSFCTLCLSKEHNLLNVFDHNETDMELPVIIRELLHFEVVQGGCLPWKICSNCFIKLKNFQNFKSHATKCKEYLESTLLHGSRHFDTAFEEGLAESHPTQTDTLILKQVEVFVNIDVAVSSDEMTEEERDPLGGEDVEVKPPALISMLDQGVSREEDSASCPLPTGNADLFGGVKQEIGDDGTETPSGIIAESSAKRRSSNVTVVSCAGVVGAAVDGGGEGVGGYQETIKEEENDSKLTSLSPQQGTSVPVATHSHLEQRRFESPSKNENYTPTEGIESTPHSTSGKEFGGNNGGHTQRKEEVRTEHKHGNVALAGNISIGSSVGDEKSEGQDFICDVCSQVFRTIDLIERHVKVPCGTVVIDCGICKTKFHDRNEYKRHESLHCGSNVSRRRAQEGVSVDLRGESESQERVKERIPPTCHVCSKTFSRKTYLKVHINTVHLKQRNFSCGICGKAFGENGRLQSHMRIHTGVRLFTCTHCHKDFTESGNLRKHILSVHKVEKPHVCEECGMAFSKKAHLTRHILVHTGERPHTCDICSKTFSLKYNLESHMLIHTGVSPYTCTLCSKTFSHSGNLKKHMATHAKNVPHPCNHCTKTFALRSELQRHLAEH